jgi:type I restriction enzyme S subunit
MVAEWPERTLGELTENFDGVRVPVKEADRRAGPYPYYGASGVVDHVDAFLFDGEYLLIAEDGENLRTRNTPVAFMARGKFWVNNHAHIVRGNSEADTRFLMYSLAATDISGYLTGSTIPKLTQGNMNRIPLLTPPLADQRAIAHILGTLDDKIELNRRMGETLSTMARALFKSWFIDFEPVRAKAEGRDPGLPKPLADLFPWSLVDSELGKIPEGWVVETLADHYQAVKGVSYKGSGLGETGMPLHNLNSVYEGGGYKYEGIKYYSGEYAERHMVLPGDLIVANTEQGHDRLLIGYAALVPAFFGDRRLA